MAMKLTITNFLQFFSGIAPLLLGFFLIMISLFNQDIKGIIYLAGVLIACVINVFFQNLIKSERSSDESPICNLIDLPFGINQFNSPALSSLFIAFTIAYLVLPMNFNGNMNYVILAALLSLFALDGVTKVFNKCTTIGGVFLGALTGFLLGAGWYTLFHVSGYDSLLYFDELKSNNVVCKRPSKQTFKCSVYKNGQLIQSNVV